MKKYLLYVFIMCSILIASCCTAKQIKENSGNDPLATLKVMTYNVHHCNPPGKSKTGDIDIDTIASVLRKQNPDLVALQEIDDHTNRSGAFNEAEEIAKRLNMHYYFGKAIDFDGGGYGVAILSKYPLSEVNTFSLPSAPGWNGERRVLATAKISLSNGKTILFGSTHLEAYNRENRDLQIKEINRIAARESLPFIVGGDFNSVPESNAIKTLDSMFTRTCVSNCPFTIPEMNPKETIDYIAFLPKDEFIVNEHNVIDEKYASDHLPVIAVLRIK
jgi:endonuclease/exonuclease/phosphatase family metal-dependent hydrolase